MEAFKLRKSLVLAGLLVIGTGLYIVLLAIGMFPAVRILEPRWILALAGMAFVLGGSLVSLGELMNHDDARRLRDIEVVRAFRNFMIAFLLIIFTVLGNWVAFGPGSRPVQIFLGLPFGGLSTQAGELVGRFGFGVGAITFDLLLVVIAYSLVNQYRGRQSDREQ